VPTVLDLMDGPGMWIDRVLQRRPLDKLILDLSNLVSETYGHRELSTDHVRAPKRTIRCIGELAPSARRSL